MTTYTEHFDLPLLEPSQAQPEVPVNESLTLIDAALWAAGGSITVKEMGDSPAGNATGVKTLFIAGATVEQLTDGGALITITAGAGSGSDTASSDVESLPPGGTTGQALVKSSSTDYAVEWSTIGGGGGSGNNYYVGGIISPDSHPGTANSMDAEFEGTTLDLTKWTWGNQGAATATIDKGAVQLTPPLTSGPELHSIEQALPSGTWTFRTKLAATVTGNYNGGGMILRESSTGKIYRFNILYNAGSIHSSGYSYSDYSTPGSSLFDATLTGPFFNSNTVATFSIASLYMELQSDGTNYVFRISENGYDGNFIQLWTGTITAFFTAGADHIGLFANCQSTSNTCVFDFDWFRRIDGAYPPVNAALMIGAGTSTANVTPATHPTTPNAVDDEFENAGGALDPKWTMYNGGSSGGTASVAQGRAIFSLATSLGVNTPTVWGQPLASPSAPWQIIMALTSTQSNSFAGLAVIIESSGSGVYFGQYGTTIYAFHQSAFTSGPTQIASGSNGINQGYNSFSVPNLILRITSDGTTLTFEYSGDGGSLFFPFSTCAIATAFGTAGVFPDTLGVYVGGTTGQNLCTDYVRRNY